jgi:hypothetical protein
LKRALQVLNLAGVAAMIAVNTLAVTLPLNGRTTRELSDAYPNLFVPAGLTFSIWSVIYVGLIALALHLASDVLPGRRDRTALVRAAGVPLLVSDLLNIGWIVAWHHERMLLSVGLMLGLLGTLLVLYVRVTAVVAGPADRWLARVPVSVYLGWISVATIANVTAWLVSLGWGGLGLSEAAWAVGMMTVAAALALAMRWRRDDVAYGLVVVWAFAGIALKRFGTEPFVASVGYAAVVLAAGVLVGLAVRRSGGASAAV